MNIKPITPQPVQPEPTVEPNTVSPATVPAENGPQASPAESNETSHRSEGRLDEKEKAARAGESSWAGQAIRAMLSSVAEKVKGVTDAAVEEAKKKK